MPFREIRLQLRGLVQLRDRLFSAPASKEDGPESGVDRSTLLELQGAPVVANRFIRLTFLASNVARFTSESATSGLARTASR